MIRESSQIASYEPPSVTELGKLEDITGTAPGPGGGEGINGKT
jgi:hypothetical protein